MAYSNRCTICTKGGTGMNTSINTVAGTISPGQLGRTLMHEHVYVEYGGACPDSQCPGAVRDEIVAACTSRIREIQAFGVESLVDPTTVDLGRNVSLMTELAERTGITIICATGIYSVSAYLTMREHMGGPDAIAELFIRELVEGIGDTGVRAGIIKVVTGQPAISLSERELLLAAARASVETGAPIITHTEGILGDEQQRILTGAGVPAHRIVIGHSCISRDFSYHRHVLQGGSYLGFDRFGMEPGMPDEVRAESMLRLIDAGYAPQLVVSHDSVWYWVGGPQTGAGAYENWKPTNFFERVIPMLHYGGATDGQIEEMLRENPRRFFAGERPAC